MSETGVRLADAQVWAATYAAASADDGIDADDIVGCADAALRSWRDRSERGL